MANCVVVKRGFERSAAPTSSPLRGGNFAAHLLFFWRIHLANGRFCGSRCSAEVLHRKIRRFEKSLFLKDFCAVQKRWRIGRDSHPVLQALTNPENPETAKTTNKQSQRGLLHQLCGNGSATDPHEICYYRAASKQQPKLNSRKSPFEKPFECFELKRRTLISS